jgi:hypothetical protein
MTELVLDMTSAFRMMHTDKDNPLVLYLDKRSDFDLANTCYQYGKLKGKPIYKNWNPKKPTIQCDFKKTPFPDKKYKLVIIDPPHRIENDKGDISLKYGVLCPETWQAEIKGAFAEGWRVLDDYGTLVFKWCEHNKDIDEILRLFPVKPVVVQKTAAAKKKNGRLGSTLWAIFLKVP